MAYSEICGTSAGGSEGLNPFKSGLFSPEFNSIRPRLLNDSGSMKGQNGSAPEPEGVSSIGDGTARRGLPELSLVEESDRANENADTIYISVPIPIIYPATLPGDKQSKPAQSSPGNAGRTELDAEFQESMRELVEAMKSGKTLDPVAKEHACAKAARLLVPYAKQSAKRLGINPDSIEAESSLLVDFFEGKQLGEYRNTKNRFVISPKCLNPCAVIDHELKHMQECLRLTAAYQYDPEGFEALLREQILKEVGRGGSRYDQTQRMNLNDAARGELSRLVMEACRRFSHKVSVEQIHTWLVESGTNYEFPGGSAALAAEVHAEVGTYHSILLSFIVPQEVIDADFYVEMAVRGYQRGMKGPLSQQADIVKLVRQAPDNLKSRCSDPLSETFYSTAREELAANRKSKARELADLVMKKPGSFQVDMLKQEVQLLSLTEQAIELHLKSRRTTGDVSKDAAERAVKSAEKFLSYSDPKNESHRKVVHCLRELGLLDEGVPKLREYPEPGHYRGDPVAIGEKLMEKDARSVEKLKGDMPIVINTVDQHNNYYFAGGEHGTTGATYVLKNPITVNANYRAGLTILAVHRQNGKWTFTGVDREGQVLPENSRMVAITMHTMMEFLEANPTLTEAQQLALIGRYLQLRGAPSQVPKSVWDKTGLKQPAPESQPPSKPPSTTTADDRTGSDQSTERKATKPASVDLTQANEPAEGELRKNFEAVQRMFENRGTSCNVVESGKAIRVDKPIAFSQRNFDGTTRTEYAKPGDYLIRIGVDHYVKSPGRHVVFQGEGPAEFLTRLMTTKALPDHPEVTEDEARQNFKDLEVRLDNSGRECSRLSRGKILVVDRPVSYPQRLSSGTDYTGNRLAGECLTEVTEPSGTKTYRPFSRLANLTIIDFNPGDEILYEGRTVFAGEMVRFSGKPHHFVTTAPTESLRVLTAEEAAAVKVTVVDGKSQRYLVENNRVYKTLDDGRLAEVETMRFVNSYDLLLAAQGVENAGKSQPSQSSDGSNPAPSPSQDGKDSSSRSMPKGLDPVPVKRPSLTSKNGTQPGPRDEQDRSSDPLRLNDTDRLVLGFERETEDARKQREELQKKGDTNDPDTRERIRELDAKIRLGEDLLSAVRNSRDPVRSRRALEAIRDALGSSEAAVAGGVGALMLASAGVGYYYHYTSKNKQYKSVPEAKDRLSKP